MNATNGPSQQLINAQKELARRRQLAGVSYRPPAAVSVDSIQCSVFSEQSTVNDQLSTINCQLSTNDVLQSSIPHSEFRNPNSANPTSDIRHPTSTLSEFSIRISPTLAAYCLDKNHRHNGYMLDAPYRLYKILGALDRDGRGWLANQEIEPLLTQKESPYYIYGRRQLKTILRRGEGLFWQRVKSKGNQASTPGVRIRLVSRARLISRLSPGSRLRGREVEIPLSYLLGSGRGRQADANAALYATVHAGRLRPDKSRSGKRKPRPISRARLSELSGCSNYRQRSYERRMDITVQRNIHILSTYNEYDLERSRQHLGLAAYKHTDYQGKINRHRRGAAYIAVRLPNSYHLPDAFTVVKSQRLRTINRFLDGLCHLGSGGSDREEIVRLYHSDVATAVRAGQRDGDTPAFWPITGSSEAQLWQTFQVRSDDFSRQSDESLTTNEQVAELLGGRMQNAECRIEKFPIPHPIFPKSQIRNQKEVI